MLLSHSSTDTGLLREVRCANSALITLHMTVDAKNKATALRDHVRDALKARATGAQSPAYNK